MSFYPAAPALLAEAEFALVRFGLDLATPCTLGLGELLGLRPLLQAAAGNFPRARCTALFDPPPSTDPAAARRYRKPAPPFVLRPAAALVGEHHEGDRLEFEVLFLGTGTLLIGDFLSMLQALGERGLTTGGGRYEVAVAHCLGADGKWRSLWRQPRPVADLAPELPRLDQWLDRNWPQTWPIVLQLATPARLVASGRVLRQPRFRQLFPFLLRRVTSMLHAHCGLEPVDDPARLLDAAAALEANWLDHRWVDWREGDAAAPVGGCMGRLRLEGPGLEELLWVLLLATLFGVGRGAAYGAGRCDLVVVRG